MEASCMEETIYLGALQVHCARPAVTRLTDNGENQ